MWHILKVINFLKKVIGNIKNNEKYIKTRNFFWKYDILYKESKKGRGDMQKEITIKELENVVNEIDDIEPMIVKRENKKDLLVISLEQYQKEMFLNKLEKSRKEYKEGKVHNARAVFEELREKYGY